MSVIKPIGGEISISAANNFNNYPLVRCVNPTANAVVITVANSSANVATLTILANSVVFVDKTNANTTIQGTGILGCPVAFTN